MSINELPSFESYDLLPSQPPLLRRPFFKKLIGLSFVFFLAALLGVFFLRQLRSAAPLPPAASDLPPFATTPDAARFNPFGSLIHPDSGESPSASASSQTSSPPFSFLAEDLQRALAALLADPDLEIREHSTGTVGGCKMKGEYLGRLKGGSQYGQSENTYAADESQSACRALPLSETYNETYYLEGLLYNRSGKSQPFKNILTTAAEPKAQKPADYLKFYFSDPADFKVPSVISSDPAVKVLTIFSKSPLTGSFAFSMDADRKVTAFSYSLTSGSGDLKAELSGEVSILRPSPAISTPPIN